MVLEAGIRMVRPRRQPNQPKSRSSSGTDFWSPRAQSASCRAGQLTSPRAGSAAQGLTSCQSVELAGGDPPCLVPAADQQETVGRLRANAENNDRIVADMARNLAAISQAASETSAAISDL